MDTNFNLKPKFNWHDIRIQLKSKEGIIRKYIYAVMRDWRIEGLKKGVKSYWELEWRIITSFAQLTIQSFTVSLSTLSLQLKCNSLIESYTLLQKGYWRVVVTFVDEVAEKKRVKEVKYEWQIIMDHVTVKVSSQTKLTPFPSRSSLFQLIIVVKVNKVWTQYNNYFEE